jgi:hypothetical protein
MVIVCTRYQDGASIAGAVALEVVIGNLVWMEECGVNVASDVAIQV